MNLFSPKTKPKMESRNLYYQESGHVNVIGIVQNLILGTYQKIEEWGACLFKSRVRSVMEWLKKHS